MPQNRFYSSTAVEAQLTAPLSSGSTSFSVNDTTGWPLSYPYTLVIDGGTDVQEIVEVTSVSSLTVDATRGIDGSTAVDHDAGASVTHDVSARDYTEPQQHIGAIAGVHGVTSDVVGTADTQELSNKTLDTPILNEPQVIGGNITGGLTVGGFAVTFPAGGGQLVSRVSTDTLANKTLTSPAINGGALDGVVLDAASTVDGITGAQIAADHATTASNVAQLATIDGAWTTWTPALTNSGSNPTASSTSCAYLIVGKTMYLRFLYTFSTRGTGTAFQLAVPGGASLKGSQIITGILRTAAGVPPSLAVYFDNSAGPSATSWSLNCLSSGTTYASLTASQLDSSAGDQLAFTAVVEIQ